jgi:hypothetical protein
VEEKDVTPKETILDSGSNADVRKSVVPEREDLVNSCASEEPVPKAQFHENTVNGQLFTSTDVMPLGNAVTILTTGDQADSYNFTTKAILVNGDNQTSFILLSIPSHLGKINIKTSMKFKYDSQKPEFLMLKSNQAD